MCPEQPIRIDVILESEAGTVITLPVPAKDDSTSLDKFIIQQRTRGNEPKQFRDPRWPIAEVTEYTFETLTDEKYLEFERFLNQTYGQRIEFTDAFNVVSDIFILNEDIQFVEERNCAHKISLRFQKL